MIPIRRQDFEKAAGGISSFLMKLTRGLSTGSEPAIIKNRLESYLQTKAGVTTGGNPGQKRRRRFPS